MYPVLFAFVHKPQTQPQEPLGHLSHVLGEMFPPVIVHPRWILLKTTETLCRAKSSDLCRKSILTRRIVQTWHFAISISSERG